jgi:hypothetical protein
MLCSWPVHLFKRSALARVIALVFLTWTAVDLTNSSLCALDQEGARQTCTTATPNLCDAEPSPAPVHIDDCFCCSHCVNAVALVFLPKAAMLVDLIPPERASALRLASSHLDHPPHLLS